MGAHIGSIYVVAKMAGNQPATTDANMCDVFRYLERALNGNKNDVGYEAMTSGMGGQLTHNLKVVGSNPTPATKPSFDKSST
jgi:hypothetical protein